MRKEKEKYNLFRKEASVHFTEKYILGLGLGLRPIFTN